jgi:hypothetical protein
MAVKLFDLCMNSGVKIEAMLQQILSFLKILNFVLTQFQHIVP